MSVLVAAPTFAGRAGVGDESENDPTCVPGIDDNCQDNTQTGPNGDPEDCQTDENTTGTDLGLCVANNAQADGYNVTFGAGPNGQPQWTILGDPIPGTGEFEEIDSFCLKESSDFIQSIDIAIDRPRLVAKLSNFVEHPTAVGTITIRVGHDPDGPPQDVVVVSTSSAFGQPKLLTSQVCDAMKNAGLSVDCLAAFLVIRADSAGESPRSVAVVVDDANLETMEVALEPKAGFADGTSCSQGTQFQLPR